MTPPNPPGSPGSSSFGDIEWTPKPDPTVLTTEAQRELATQLRMEIEQLMQGAREHVDGAIKVLEERLLGIDRATELRLKDIIDIPKDIDEKVEHLQNLVDERFNSIAIQFAERDTRQERETRDNTVKVDAAFAAAKEASAKQDEANQKAIDKAEQQTTEKITKQGELSQKQVDALGDKIDDVKARMGQLEARFEQLVGQRVGAAVTVSEHREQQAPFVNALLGLFAGVILAGVGFLLGH